MVTIETIQTPTDQQPAAVRGWFARIWRGLAIQRRNRRTRLHLRDLDNAALEDIGVTPHMAEVEIRRSRLLF